MKIFSIHTKQYAVLSIQTCVFLKRKNKQLQTLLLHNKKKKMYLFCTYCCGFISIVSRREIFWHVMKISIIRSNDYTNIVRCVSHVKWVGQINLYVYNFVGSVSRTFISLVIFYSGGNLPESYVFSRSYFFFFLLRQLKITLRRMYMYNRFFYSRYPNVKLVIRRMRRRLE